jgi:hypothetical protein
MNAFSASVAHTLFETAGFTSSSFAPASVSLRRSQQLSKSFGVTRTLPFANTACRPRFQLGELVYIKGSQHNAEFGIAVDVKIGSIGRITCIHRRQGASEATYKVEFDGVSCSNWDVDLWWKESDLAICIEQHNRDQKENHNNEH